jgi:hypothetical protein
MESQESILEETKQLLENSKRLEREMSAQKDCLNFLLNEYKTNKRWFREEPGKVTTEDIIKACFQFGWASHNDFEYKEKRYREKK